MPRTAAGIAPLLSRDIMTSLSLTMPLLALLQMLAAGGGEGTRLDDAGRRALSARQDALRARRAHGLGDEVPGGEDPELQDFLVGKVVGSMGKV